MNKLIARYGKEKRFVTWNLETKNGKQTKLPYQLSGKLASSTNPDTWATYADIKKARERVGIVLHDRLLLGLDLDHVLKDGKIVHEKKEMIDTLLKAANSYTEISQSGEGLHIFIELVDPLTLVSNKKAPVECYTVGRYIALTNNVFGKQKSVRKMSAEEAWRIVEIAVPQDSEKAPAPSLLNATAGDTLDLIQHMFNAQNGDDIRALYEGDTKAYDGDESRADMALLAHLAFWTQKNAQQMEEIWLASPLGRRQKTQKRVDYRKRTIAVAIKNCKEVYKPVSRGTSKMKIGDEHLDLMFAMKGKHKVYFKNMENMKRLVLRHPDFEGTFRYDAYKEVIERKVSGQWRYFRDHDILDVQSRISVLFADFANIQKGMVYDAIVDAAYTNTIDSGADYLRSLVWDGTARLDTWPTSAYNTPVDEYHRSVGSNWLKGLVKRAVDPGCKFDHVLVLEGPQGIKKSTSLMVLAGSLGHVETSMSTESKDFFMQFLGNAIVEFSEGETLSRTEVKRLKAIITVQVDKFRDPYGKSVIPHPRRCVFAMTTNLTEYLKDETGNRRWLPVAVNGTVNLEWLQENREQLLAEAYHRVVTKKETTWEFPEKETREQQQARRIEDANTEPVVNWYVQLSQAMRNEGVTVDQVSRESLHNGFAAPTTTYVRMGIADILKNTLYLEKRRMMVGGMRMVRWYPTEETPAPIIVGVL